MTSRMQRLARGSLVILAVGTTTIALSACKHTEPGTRVAGWTLVDAAQRHPILVSQAPETMNLSVARSASGLSPAQRARLLDFTSSFSASSAGGGRLVVQAPSGSANEVAAMHVVQDIRRTLIDGGIGESDVVVEAYLAEGSGQPPVKVSYLRFVAEAPECSDWSTNLARQPDNLAYPNFGCATQRNFAAQVANPADLLGPRTMTARASERRDTTWNKYVKGDTTNAKKSEDEKVKVAKESN
ncbi:MAG: CpaD family pilus assembly protein [Hyphomicrobiaceae bacterium]|nr:CpaD family pilus assembly protein [Hyphomicrobiaceae bacterium]